MLKPFIARWGVSVNDFCGQQYSRPENVFLLACRCSIEYLILMAPDTPISLLEKLREPRDQRTWEQAWREFVELYTPVLYFWVQRLGLDRAAADLVVQDVFALLVENIKQFHRDKGRFRTWLRTIAINKYRETRRQHLNDPKPLPEEPILDRGQIDPAEEFWHKDFRDHVVRRALIIMKRDFSEECWQGFWMFFIEKKPAAQIAAAQGKSVSAVIAANYRILTRLKEEFGDMIE